METFQLIGSIAISVLFFVAGLIKLIKSYEKLNERMKWTQERSGAFIRFIAISEILGAVGFILPYYLNFIPILSTISTIGLVILMIGAPITHLKLGEHKEAGFTTFVLVLILIISFLRLFY